MTYSRKDRMDALGDRMKSYENIETDQKFPPNSIIYVRLDGRSFSKFTKGMIRPFDYRMTELMKETTKFLHKEFRCKVSYTQSDEISLIIENKYDSPMIFEAKKQKIISSLAASASAFFVMNLHKYFPEKMETSRPPTFDARAFVIPTRSEAANALLWREKDCIKNSVSMAAREYYSHSELHKKSSLMMKDMLLFGQGIDYNMYPKSFRIGTYFKRVLMDTVDNQINPRSIVTEVDAVLSEMTHEDRINFIFG